MEFLGEVWDKLLVVAAALVLLGNAIKTVGNWVAPARRLGERIDRHDKLLSNDKERIDEMEGMLRQLCNSLKALLDHEITGNGIDRLKQARDDLDKFLINR